MLKYFRRCHGTRSTNMTYLQGFLSFFRDPIRVPENQRKLVPRIRDKWVPRITEIGYLQVHIGYVTFSLKKLLTSERDPRVPGAFAFQSIDAFNPHFQRHVA